MPKIPLADIPNAPQLGFGSHPQTMGGVDLGHAATLLTIPQGTFDGPARGMQSIAQGIDKAGNAIEEIGMHIQRQRDEYALNKATEIWTKEKLAADEEYASNQTNPLAYPEIQERHLNSANGQIFGGESDLLSGISDSGRQRILQNFSTFSTRVMGEAKYAAANNLFNRNKEYAVETIKDLVSKGQIDLAVQQIEANRGTHLNDAQALGLSSWAKKEGDLQAVTSDMEADPIATRERLKIPENYPNLPVLKRPGLIDQTYTEEKKQEAHTIMDISDGIENGTLTSLEQIQGAFNNPGQAQAVKLNEAAIQRKLAGKLDPEFQAKQYSAISSQISALDSSSNDFDGKQAEIVKAINLTLDGELKSLATSYLSSMVSRERKPSAQLMTYANKVVNNLATNQTFGWFDKDAPEWGNPETTKLHNEVLGKISRVKIWATQQVQQHPEWKEPDVLGAINQHIMDEKLAKAPDITTGHLWWKKTVPGDPNSMLPASTPAQNPSAKMIKSKADYDALPSGAKFIGNDGKVYSKP